MQDFIQEIIKEAGFLAKGYYHAGVTHTFKSNPGDLVTEADKETEEFLVSKIQEKYPEHGIISEERVGEINPGAEYTWVIDPIDGTRNFANHVAYWCVMVGVTKNGKPYLGAIYDAMNDELFFAEAGKGAFLNGALIKVSKNEDAKTCFMVFNTGHNNTGSPYDSPAYENYARFYNNMVGDTGRWFYSYGSMLCACHLAAGRIDSVVLNSGMYHDYLAASVIVSEAGAKCTNSVGETWKRGDMDIVVANPVLHKKLMKFFEE